MTMLIGGRFAGPTNKQKNLVAVDGTSGVAGGSPRWFNSPVLESLLAAPDLGRVYGGGVSLTAFDFESGNVLWTRAKTTVDQTLRTHYLKEGYRDLERDGSTIWAACGCDTVAAPDGTPNAVKALVKLDTEGNPRPHLGCPGGDRCLRHLACPGRQQPLPRRGGQRLSGRLLQRRVAGRAPGFATPRDLPRRWR